MYFKDNKKEDRLSSQLKNNLKKRKQQKNLRSNMMSDTEITPNKQENNKQEILKITGNQKFNGTITLSGAKNAALPIIIASILSNQDLTLNNVPNLADIETILAILKDLNVSVVKTSNNSYILNASKINKLICNEELVSKMRASFLVVGALLTKYKEAQIHMPGGCSIGSRPIDLHLEGLKAMGATIEVLPDSIKATAKDGLKGCDFTFSKVSVGATEHLIMAAVLATGKTVLRNCAIEPEITDLITCLNKMGAKITGQGTNTISIQGVKELQKATHTVILDRIEAGSYALAAAITKGSITLVDFPYDLLDSFFDSLIKSGAIVEKKGKDVFIQGSKIIHPVDIQTKEYPGFPTDLQAQWITYICLANGKSELEETIFENRFLHVDHLNNMGANITIKSKQHCIIEGVSNFTGANVIATDLRASFALIMAAIVANGVTTISNLTHLDRGYENPIQKFQSCNILIERTKDY